MNRRNAWTVFEAAALSTIAGLAGCAGSGQMERAQAADRDGEHHLAYDSYCEAARSQPGSSSLAASIRRVAPLAARHWEAQALLAYDEGRINEAWRAAVRVLEIQPDHASAIQLVRRIERLYPVETQGARLDWERNPVGTPPDASLFATRPQDPFAPLARSEPESHDSPIEPIAGSSNGAETDAQADPAVAIAAATTTDDVTTADGRTISPAESLLRVPVPEPDWNPLTESAGSTRPRAYHFGVRHQVPGRRQQSAEVRYRVRHILSRDDDRHEDEVETIDGITLKLRDTDESPLDADIDVYVGERRVLRLRDVRVSGSATVVGTSGRSYELVLFDIRDATETVVLGLREMQP